jgi:hypothetical protein
MKLTVATCQFSISSDPHENLRIRSEVDHCVRGLRQALSRYEPHCGRTVLTRSMDVVAAARSCANQHDGSYAACSDVFVLFEYGLSRMPDVNYQSVPEPGTNNVVFSTEHSKGGSAYQFVPAAGDRIRPFPRFS